MVCGFSETSLHRCALATVIEISFRLVLLQITKENLVAVLSAVIKLQRYFCFN